MTSELAPVKSLICPSVEPCLCITPLRKGLKASPCHSVVSPRLMGAVARDLHIMGRLSVCSLYYEDDVSITMCIHCVCKWKSQVCVVFNNAITIVHVCVDPDSSQTTLCSPVWCCCCIPCRSRATVPFLALCSALPSTCWQRHRTRAPTWMG